MELFTSRQKTVHLTKLMWNPPIFRPMSRRLHRQKPLVALHPIDAEFFKMKVSLATDQDTDMLATQDGSVGLTTPLQAKQRDPNRRPLLVDKAIFSRVQETQRLAKTRANLPNIDLAVFGTAALRIVFEQPNADQLIIQQALKDLAVDAEGLMQAG